MAAAKTRSGVRARRSPVRRTDTTTPPSQALDARAAAEAIDPPRDEAVPSSLVREFAVSDVWFDRDLGWLEFNRRVLAEAQDTATPLLERLKFLAIFTSNLDEFFMKRMSVLRGDATPERQALIGQIRERLQAMLHEQATTFCATVAELAAQGVSLLRWSELTSEQRHQLGTYFDSQVSAALTPLVIRPSQPFPFFSNLSLSLGFVLEDNRTSDSIEARVKVPADLPQWVPVPGTPPGQRAFVRLHEIIRENAHKLYPGMRLSAPTLFRLTRDAEVEMEEEADLGVRELIRAQIRQRRFEPVVRLEFAAPADARVQRLLETRFSLTPNDVYTLEAELDYASLMPIALLDEWVLRDAPWTPAVPPRLIDGDSIFDVIREGDLLVHHPYESFDASVEQFISSAAADPRTVAIKMTVYRVGDDTPFVRSLIRAAEAGKQVACVIELQARFDEERNLHWAAELERAGAHVTVGDLALKTHAKIALVVRKEEDGLRSYAHIGTGNYHVRTARLYTDLGLLTCDPAVTTDVVNLFHHLTGRSDMPQFQTLFVAPDTMRQRFLELIAREAENCRAGRPARIVAKMNQLEDPAIVSALCDASRAGVPIDLIIRGFCCLRPGIPDHTETIRVRSIIGRFLEHSRVFYFAAGQEDPLSGDYFIGSADWMFRNLSRRVEVVAPVLDANARARLWEILSIGLSDVRQAWSMQSDGTYIKATPEESAGDAQRLGTHRQLMELTRERSARSL